MVPERHVLSNNYPKFHRLCLRFCLRRLATSIIWIFLSTCFIWPMSSPCSTPRLLSWANESAMIYSWIFVPSRMEPISKWWQIIFFILEWRHLRVATNLCNSRPDIIYNKHCPDMQQSFRYVKFVVRTCNSRPDIQPPSSRFVTNTVNTPIYLVNI